MLKDTQDIPGESSDTGVLDGVGLCPGGRKCGGEPLLEPFPPPAEMKIKPLVNAFDISNNIYLSRGFSKKKFLISNRLNFDSKRPLIAYILIKLPTHYSVLYLCNFSLSLNIQTTRYVKINTIFEVDEFFQASNISHFSHTL